MDEIINHIISSVITYNNMQNCMQFYEWQGFLRMGTPNLVTHLQVQGRQNLSRKTNLAVRWQSGRKMQKILWV